MKISELFKIAIEAGIENDPSKEKIDEIIKNKTEKYNNDKYKKYLLNEYEYNPYIDSNLFFNDDNLDIKNIAIGIDVETPELLLVDRMRERGEKIDLVIGHHPEGKSIFGLNKMISIQEELLISYGIGVSNAEKIMSESVDKYEKSLRGLNYNRAVDAAKILNIPFINLHTPADNMVHMFLVNLFEKNRPYKLENIIEILMNEKEYQYAYANNNGPIILNGSENSRAGKIYVDVTGGVEASDKIYEELKNKGVDTLVGMHMSESHLKKAKEFNINVVIAGHMSSDTIGMNLLIDEIEKKEKFEKIYNLSGFVRNKRN